jgi:hypothetical protein
MEQRVPYNPHYRARSRLGERLSVRIPPGQNIILSLYYQSVLDYNPAAWSWLPNSNALWPNCAP